MSQITETICDQCGARKGKGNHWFGLLLTDQSFNLFRVGHTDSAKDICGVTCAARALQEFMNPNCPAENLLRDSNPLTKELNEILDKEETINDLR